MARRAADLRRPGVLGLNEGALAERPAAPRRPAGGEAADALSCGGSLIRGERLKYLCGKTTVSMWGVMVRGVGF